MSKKRIQTPLTKLLGIEKPIMLAGMGGIASPELAGAVSSAGGFGTLGLAASVWFGAKTMKDDILRCKELSHGKPFGVDLLLPKSEGGRMKNAFVRSIIESGAKLFVSGLGFPDAGTINRFHDGGVLVAAVCGRVRHARKAVAAGVDFVIAQGTEAGGHTGRIASSVLIPQIVDAVGDQVPVVAAGGFFDGRGLAAALALGASGVWCGSRFVASHEARVVPGYHRKIIESESDDTVVSKAYTGRTVRTLRNKYTDYFEQNPDKLNPNPALQLMDALKANAIHLGGCLDTVVDEDKEAYIIGQCIGGIHSIVSAQDIVNEMNDTAWDILNSKKRKNFILHSKL